MEGKVVVGGYMNPNGAALNYFAAARLNPDGSLDDAFNFDGNTYVNFGADDKAYALAAQPDGRVLLAGGTAGDFALARLVGDEVRLTAAVTDGKAVAGAGKAVTYTVMFANAGPDAAVAAAARVTGLGGLTGVTFTSAAAGGATGNAAAGTAGTTLDQTPPCRPGRA